MEGKISFELEWKGGYQTIGGSDIATVEVRGIPGKLYGVINERLPRELWQTLQIESGELNGFERRRGKRFFSCTLKETKEVKLFYKYLEYRQDNSVRVMGPDGKVQVNHYLKPFHGEIELETNVSFALGETYQIKIQNNQGKITAFFREKVWIEKSGKSQLPAKQIITKKIYIDKYKNVEDEELENMLSELKEDLDEMTGLLDWAIQREHKNKGDVLQKKNEISQKITEIHAELNRRKLLY